MDASLWVGLDLGETRTSTCVADETGKPILEEDCETSVEALEACLGAFPLRSIALIGVEAGKRSAPHPETSRPWLSDRHV
jgi:hypothetical protein